MVVKVLFSEGSTYIPFTMTAFPPSGLIIVFFIWLKSSSNRVFALLKPLPLYNTDCQLKVALCAVADWVITVDTAPGMAIFDLYSVAPPFDDSSSPLIFLNWLG